MAKQQQEEGSSMTLSDFDDEFEGNETPLPDDKKPDDDDETKKPDEDDGDDLDDKGSDNKSSAGDSGDEGGSEEGDDEDGEGDGAGDEGDEGDGDEGEGGDEEEDDFEALNEILGFKPSKELDFSIDGYATYAREFAEKRSKDAIGEYDEQFKKSNPRVYSYMMHLQNGGTDEQFFNVVTDDYSDWELKDDDKETAKRIMSTALREKGLPDDLIRRNVLASEDEGKLVDDAKSFQASKKKAMVDWHKQQETTFQETQAQQKELADGMLSSISNTLIKQGKLDKLIIPEADKKAFYQHVTQNMLFDGQSFYMVNPITPENVGSALESEYFKFKKGDLDELIKRKVKTATARQLRLKKDKLAGQKKGPKGEKGREDTGGITPLGSL